jgi:hypothetical protein
MKFNLSIKRFRGIDDVQELHERDTVYHQSKLSSRRCIIQHDTLIQFAAANRNRKP